MDAETSLRDRRLHLLGILAVVVLGYFVRPARLPLIGEETTRAEHGIEMAQSGDWLYPTIQGQEILDRPPLQYWFLALVHRYVHPLDPLTLRLVSALLTLATALAVWVYAGRVLRPTGALVAALSFATMGHVLEIGRRVETDGLFTLLLAGSLFVWHYGHVSRWRPSATWVAGGLVAALATLAKGSQAPVAFFGAVYLFLALRRELRSLWSGAHLAGLVAFLAPIAAFQVPFHLRAGWLGTRSTWFDPGASRAPRGLADLARSLFEFPVETLGAMLPWTLFLVGLLAREFWRGREERTRSSHLFLGLGVLCIFAPVWIADGRPRYVMPMYPLVAVLVGSLADRCVELDGAGLVGRAWRVGMRALPAVLGAFALVLLAATVAWYAAAAGWAQPLAQPPWLLAAFLALVALLAPRVWRLAREPRRLGAAAALLALLVAGAYNGPLIEMSARRRVHLWPEMRAFRATLPADVRVVSFERLHHRFLYAWQGSIPILSWPERAEELPPEVDYVALNARYGVTRELPFDWEPVRVFSTEVRIGDPEKSVILARPVR